MGELTGPISPLADALLADDLDRFAALLRGGADPSEILAGGTTIVHLASEIDDTAYLDLLLDAGAHANIANPTTGETPLMAALRSSREPQFRRLLDAGADPGLADADGDTPLHVAGLIKAPDRVLDLLDAGADATVRNRQGHTFKTYLDIRPSSLSEDAQRRFDAVEAWLADHDVDLDADVPA